VNNFNLAATTSAGPLAQSTAVSAPAPTRSSLRFSASSNALRSSSVTFSGATNTTSVVSRVSTAATRPVQRRRARTESRATTSGIGGSSSQLQSSTTGSTSFPLPVILPAPETSLASSSTALDTVDDDHELLNPWSTYPNSGFSYPVPIFPSAPALSFAFPLPHALVSGGASQYQLLRL